MIRNKFIICFILILSVVGKTFSQSVKTTFSQLNTILKKNPNVKTIFIEKGVYNDVNLTLVRLNGIEIMAEEEGKVVLEGNTNITFRNCNKITFSGFHFKETWSQYLIKLEKVTNSIIKENFFDRTKGNAYSRVIGLQGISTNNIITNNTFEGIHTMGITISKDRNYYNVIHKNVFRNIPRVTAVHPSSKDGNGMETISIGTVAHWDEEMEKQEFNTTVSNNYFENIEGDMNEIICVKANKNIIENNYFTRNKGGVSLRYGSNNTVRNNIFEKNGQNIIVWGKGHKIIDNIIYDDNIGIQLPSSHFTNSISDIKRGKAGFFQVEDVLIQGNIIYTRDRNPFFIGRHLSQQRNLLPTNVRIQNNQSNIENINSNRHIFQLKTAQLENNSEIQNPERIKRKINSKAYCFGKTW